MGNWTPAPWSLRISSKGYENKFQIQRKDGACLFSFGDSPFHDDAEADARLIAAAPDLLNALSVLANAAEARGIPVDAARAAIAKATGETK